MRSSLFAIAAAGCSVTGIDVKTAAPAASTATPFSLRDQNGTAFDLADTHGDVVLVFYRGHW